MRKNQRNGYFPKNAPSASSVSIFIKMSVRASLKISSDRKTGIRKIGAARRGGGANSEQ